MKLTLVATCLFGLERLLGEEIDALGYKRIHTIDGRVILKVMKPQLQDATFGSAQLSMCSF